jgi:hypothetical protein
MKHPVYGFPHQPGYPPHGFVAPMIPVGPPGANPALIPAPPAAGGVAPDPLLAAFNVWCTGRGRGRWVEDEAQSGYKPEGGSNRGGPAASRAADHGGAGTSGLGGRKKITLKTSHHAG